jgi:hypothetical protein
LGDWHHAYAERPLGVTVIAILYFINALIAFTGIAVIAFLAGQIDFFEPYPVPDQAFAQPMVGPDSYASWIVWAVGIVLGVIGGISALIGVGLLKGRRWARNLAIAFAVVNIVFYALAIPGTFGGSLAMVFFNGFILWYLYRPHVVAYFRS